MIRFIISIIIFINLYLSAIANENRLIIASTTSTYDSGFLEYINNEFEKKNKVKIHVLSLGTGQALEIAKNGDVDILLIHHKPSELKFIDNGFGLIRHDLMYNDFLIVGPKKNNFSCKSIEDFLKIIKKKNLIFVSRGDESGTYKKEKELWRLHSLNPEIYLNNYIKVGQGMGATLMITNEMKGYTLVDRATWLSYKNKINLKIICQNKPPLMNQYGIIAVNPKINDKINTKWALKYINWLISEDGKNLINNFKKNGKQLFFYNFK